MQALRQIPPSLAARFVAVPASPDDEFPLVTQLRAATDHAGLARQLLRLSDELALRYGDELRHVCRSVGFLAGIAYLDCRAAAASAIRTRDGELPPHVLETLNIWRAGLVAVAGGMGK